MHQICEKYSYEFLEMTPQLHDSIADTLFIVLRGVLYTAVLIKQYIYIYIYIFFLVQCHYMSFVEFVVLPPGHGRNVTDFWGWDAHEAQLRCPDGVSGDRGGQEGP